MIISTEEWIKFREDGQKFALEKIESLLLRIILMIFMNRVLLFRTYEN